MITKKFTIKQGREEQWRDWCDFLITNKDEVLDTMKEEGLTRESCWIRGNNIFYSIEGAGRPGTDREINQMHRKNRAECLELPGQLVTEIPRDSELLFDFTF